MCGVESLRHRQSTPFFDLDPLVFQRVTEPGRKAKNVQAGKTKYQFTDRISFQEKLEGQAAAPTGEHKIFLSIGKDPLNQGNRQTRQVHSSDSQSDPVWNDFHQFIET
jgi:hypothetical protein